MRYEFLLFIIVLFMVNNYILTTYSNNNMKLFDTIHYITPIYFINLSPISDFMTFFLLITTCFFLYYKKSIYSFLKCIIMCQLIKKIVGISTILPDPSGHCNEKQFQFILGRCNDLVISGHACTILSCYYYLDYYINTKYVYYYVMLNMILIVISRNHYTIDVIFSYFVTNYILDNHIKDTRFLKSKHFFVW
jgi:hypothetical protein